MRVEGLNLIAVHFAITRITCDRNTTRSWLGEIGKDVLLNHFVDNNPLHFQPSTASVDFVQQKVTC